MMSRTTRWVMGIAVLLLGTAYLLPLWQIDLKAPQYPEGLGMYIWVDQITGQQPFDLKNINGLNHYIGMQEIVPESIPELQLMPKILAGLMVLGFGAALWGRRKALYAWTTLFLLGAVAGLADFWKWSYDYGHNLDPTAAISIPGMSYQPPLFGSKKLLNFLASSYPASGGWIAFAVLLTAIVLTVREYRRRRHDLAGAAPA